MTSCDPCRGRWGIFSVSESPGRNDPGLPSATLTGRTAQRPTAQHPTLVAQCLSPNDSAPCSPAYSPGMKSQSGVSERAKRVSRAAICSMSSSEIVSTAECM